MRPSRIWAGPDPRPRPGPGHARDPCRRRGRRSAARGRTGRGSRARERVEPHPRDVRRAVDRLAPAGRLRLRSGRRQVRGRPPEAPPVGDPDREAERVGCVALRRGPAVRVDGPGRRPQHRSGKGRRLARPRQGVGAPRDVLQRHPRLQPARELPPLPAGTPGDRAHPPAQRALLQQAARRPRARGEPDVRHERHRVHDPTRVRGGPRQDAVARPRRVRHLLQDGVVRHVSARPAGRRLRLRVGRTRGSLLAAVHGHAAGSGPQGAARRPGHGQAAAASAGRQEPRRLGRAAQLGLGHRRDVRDQLGRLDVQRVRARRELQPDQPSATCSPSSSRRTTRSRCSRTSTTSTTRPSSTAGRAWGRRCSRASSCHRPRSSGRARRPTSSCWAP